MDIVVIYCVNAEAPDLFILMQGVVQESSCALSRILKILENRMGCCDLMDKLLLIMVQILCS